MALDHTAPGFAAELASALARASRGGASVVVHCAGPYQAQSGYSVARAAMVAGAHYVDIADGRAFVAGFGGALPFAGGPV